MKTDLSPSPYTAFAPFYDAFTSSSDYEHWTEQVLAAAAPHGLAGDRLLDVACGTGKSFYAVPPPRPRVTGCDGSPEMLAEAARKSPGADLHVCDMRALPALGAFDLVTCFDDSLNYLADGDELLACFRGVAGNLAPRGLFVFDLNTVRTYRTTFARDSVIEAGGAVFAWRGESTEAFAEGDATAAAIEIFAPAGDGLYERVVTRHEQRHHPAGEVAALLEEAGLDARRAPWRARRRAAGRHRRRGQPAEGPVHRETPGRRWRPVRITKTERVLPALSVTKIS